MKEKLNYLKENFGFITTSDKWVPSAGELLKYVNVELIAIEFNRKDVNSDWTSNINRAIIKELSDYDPILGVYKCKYRYLDKDKLTEWREISIIPQGFSLINEASTWMIRFVPFSLHCKMSEEDAFNKKLKTLYLSDSIKTEELLELNNNPESINLLQSRNIGLVVKTMDNNYLWIRCKKINIHHDFKDTYTLTIKSTNDKVFIEKIKSDVDKFNFMFEKEHIGEFKIIDLSRL